VCSLPHRDFITEDDFQLFFDAPETAAAAFAFFDVDKDGSVSKSEVKEAVLNIYKERKNMAASLQVGDHK
jgi:Ca2+-binding EF-hand superfamily protein